MNYEKIEGALLVDIEIYDSKVIFIFGDINNIKTLDISEQEVSLVLEYVEENVKDYELDSRMGLTLELGSQRYSVYLPNLELFNPTSMGTLSHEIGHVVYCLLSDIGMRLTNASQEAYTYLDGYLTEKVFEYMFDKMRESND